MKRMKKNMPAIIVLCVSFVMTSLLAGCGSNTDNQSNNYETGSIIIKYQNSPSFGAYDEMFTREITLDVEQNLIIVSQLKIYDDDGNEYGYGNEPILSQESATIDSNSSEEVFALINSSRYNKLDDVIKTSTLDGDYSYIYVEQDNEVISRKGGLGAAYDGPKAFTKVCDRLNDIAKKAGLH